MGRVFCSTVSMNTASLGCRGADPEARLRRLCLSLPKQELRSTFAAVDVLTSLKWRGSPPTAALVRRKVDSLTWIGAQDALCFLIDRTIADRHGWLSPHEFDGMTRAVRSFLADTAAEVAHVHARGGVASEQAVGLARDQASHLLRIGLELRAAARRRRVPLVPIATDLHVLAMTELAKGGEAAALGRLDMPGATVFEGGCCVSAAGSLVSGTAFCAAMIEHGDSLGPICCGTCHRVVNAGELSLCRRCGDHLFCKQCLAGDGPARHARECMRVRGLVRSLAQSVLPRIRESARCVAVVQLNGGGLIVPMHITSITSPLVPSSLLEAIMRLSADACSDVVVYWRLLVAFLAQPEGDAQELPECDGATPRVDPAAHAVAEDQAGPARKAPAPLPSEKRRLQKEKRAAKRTAREDARAAAAAAAVAEANAVLERQAARPDATAAILTSVLLKRGGTASPEVVARTRAKRDSLKAIERDARRPARAKSEESIRLTNDRLAAALLLQRHARTWLRCRKKLRRKQRGRAAKIIQRSVRTWLLLLRVVAKPYTVSTAASSGSEDADGEKLVEPPEPEATEPPSTEPVSTECVICWDGDAEYAAVPCGHRCLCANCSQTVSECPMCRAAITAVLRVFV